MAKRMPSSFYLFAFSCGVICHRFLNELIPWWLTVAGLILCAIAAVRWRPLRLALCLVLGLTWANIVAADLLNKTIDRALEKKDVLITGKIIGVPLHTQSYARFDFDVDTLEWEARHYPSPGKIRLKAYHNGEVFKAGQAWRFTVRLKRSRSYQNPGSRFNYETYLFENRIRATGYIRDADTNKLLRGGSTQWSISKFRERFADFVNTKFGDNPRHGILTALVVGVRGAMRDADWRILQNTGTIHLVAISGLHIGLVSGMVMWVTARIWRLTGQMQTRIPAINVGILCGLFAGFCYALLAGMTIPTRRAAVMLTVVGICMVMRRKPGSFELLILALGIVLILDPLSPLSNGFWLSFGAVAVIVYCLRHRGGGDFGNTSNQWHRKTKGWISVQLGLSFGLAPILLLVFHQLSLVAPLANMIAIPVVGFFVVPVSLTGMCLFAVGLVDWASSLFELGLYAVHQLWFVLQALGNAQWSIWYPPSPPIWTLALALAGVTLLLVSPAFPARLTAIFWFLPLLFFNPASPEYGVFKYTMLEVGHGLAGVVETKNHTLVYDTGPKFDPGMDAGRTVVVPYLKSRGIKSIDTLVISHEHNDHSGGYEAINENFSIQRRLTGVPAAFPGFDKCTSGQSWTWDGVIFQVLWPLQDHKISQFSKGNNASCVLRISARHGSLLLTADIETPVERILADRYQNQLTSDVLQVPHQGSKTSSSRVFLDAIQPKLALLSTGYLNRFGHPHEVVSKRYDQRNITVLDTAHTGAISLVFENNAVTARHRDDLNGYWFGR